MPPFAEQPHNAKLILSFEIGSVLNKYNLNEHIIYTEISEVLNKPIYKERVEKLQQIFLDRPIDALDEAEFYVKQLIKRPKKLFKRIGSQLNLNQYFNLDFILFIVIFIYKLT